MTNTQEAQRIFNTVEEMLESTKYGFEDLVTRSSPKAFHGLKTLIVFGRAVTNVLQNLRPIWPGFDSWYKRYREEMEADQLMKYFYKLRSVILKQASHQIGIVFHMKEVDMPGDLLGLGAPPPNASGAFSGSGMGWIVPHPDGSIERRYVDLPPDKVSMNLVLPDPPKYHLNEKINDTSAPNLAGKYVEYLQKTVESAKRQFNREIQTESGQ